MYLWHTDYGPYRRTRLTDMMYSNGHGLRPACLDSHFFTGDMQLICRCVAWKERRSSVAPMTGVTLYGRLGRLMEIPLSWDFTVQRVGAIIISYSVTSASWFELDQYFWASCMPSTVTTTTTARIGETIDFKCRSPALRVVVGFVCGRCGSWILSQLACKSWWKVAS